MSNKFDQIHMETAWSWARFGTCQRLRVGSVLAADERIVATGYNGAPPGLPHCTHDLSAPFDPEDRCRNAVHAELNVIAFAARRGLSTLGSTLYITHAPCYACAGAIISAGIVKIVFHEHYRSTEGLDQLSLAGIEVENFLD